MCEIVTARHGRVDEVRGKERRRGVAEAIGLATRLYNTNQVYTLGLQLPRVYLSPYWHSSTLNLSPSPTSKPTTRETSHRHYLIIKRGENKFNVLVGQLLVY